MLTCLYQESLTKISMFIWCVCLLFSFLEIDNTVRHKASVPSTGSSPDSSGFELAMCSICLVNRPMVVACGLLFGLSDMDRHMNLI